MRATFKESLSDTMHSVHYASVTGEDDGIAQVRFHDETGVFYDLAACWRMARPSRPKRFVDFPDRRKRNAFTVKAGRQDNKAINIPCAEAVRTGAKVILLPHAWGGDSNA